MKCMNFWMVGLLCLALVSPTVADSEARAMALVAEMTLEEKIALIGGDVKFGATAVPRLGVRSLVYADASCGLRASPEATSFPCTLGLAATMNIELAAAYGDAIGEECRYYGVDYLLGPGVNIYRVHMCGRNFEYMGADPYLARKLVVPYIKGVQQHGVGATIKHFVANNTDWHRKQSNSVVSERALREIYFPAFKAAVQEGEVASVMNAYNRVNGVYAGYHSWLLKDVLREDWGFDGFVMSDWKSIFDLDTAWGNGLDQECPFGEYFNEKDIKARLADGRIDEREIDGMCERILKTAIRMGMLDRAAQEGSWRGHHKEVAEAIARESVVLLKNKDGVLPLDSKRYPKVAVVGWNVVQTTAGGGGAAFFKNKPFTNVSLSGALAKGSDEIRWLGMSDDWFANARETEDVKAKETGKKPRLIMVMDHKEAKQVAADADLIIVGVGSDFWHEREAKDQPFELRQRQYDFLDEMIGLGKKVVVVNVSGSGMDMTPFASRVDGIVQMFFPGEHGGEALADVLLGKVNPSGRLPFTLGKRAEDHHWYGRYLPEGEKIGTKAYWKHDPSGFWDCEYGEGVFVDYRWFDTEGIEPLYGFGHGLSYTTFVYEGLTLRAEGDEIVANVRVKNVGDRGGKEVVQLYVSDLESSEERPTKELKGFVKVDLAVGESKTVTLRLEKKDLMFWSEKLKDWKAEPGLFEVLVGGSSRDTPIQGRFVLGDDGGLAIQEKP
ncbi:beta-glucosidase family protein [Poriferisphaera sp. WC338]|uniref:beta-glucosidase family protein n=1 Tax=Poriferisphaera sp. WC338 TaxID=3425129 RepID=UPI003D81817F